MSYTLAAAAMATGLSETTILKAIEDGSIAATLDERGEWRLERAELDLLHPPDAERSSGSDTVPPLSALDVDALGAQIEALLRQAAQRLRQQADARRTRDDGRERDAAAQLLPADDRM
jgi:excisionase family DNA binding protein